MNGNKRVIKKRKQGGIVNKTLEERIIGFAADFVKAVVKINKNLIYENDFIYYNKKKLMMGTIMTCSKKFLPDYAEEQEKDVREFTGKDVCAAYLTCEGELYEKMYGYSAYREDIYGDGDEARRLHEAAYDCSETYDLWFEWADGALLFYDDAYTKISRLLKHEFYDGEKRECPIAIVGPAGSERKTMLRVYAYGGCIGWIATRSKDNGHLADKKFAKYLGEKWLLKGNETDRAYLEYMNEEYVGWEEEETERTEDMLCKELESRLQKILDDGIDWQLEEPEYLDLILKAAQKKFLSSGENEKERRVQTAIVREHMKKDPQAEWSVVDMEYRISQSVSLSKGQVDLVVFDKNKGFGLMELKYDDKSTENLSKHYTDVQAVMQNKEAIKKITDELKRRSKFLWNYGLISDEIYHAIEASDSHSLWQGFLFVGGTKENAVRRVKDLAGKHEEIKTDGNCRFAYFSYEKEAGVESIQNIKLDAGSMEIYEDFIKD